MEINQLTWAQRVRGCWVENRITYFHSELVLPACPVDRILAGHTKMTVKTQPSEHTSVNEQSAQADSYKPQHHCQVQVR